MPRLGLETLTGLGLLATVTAMASMIEPYITVRRFRRAEYDALVDQGMFVGERLELLDGLLVVREPQGSSHAAIVAQIGQVLQAEFGAGWHARLGAPVALDEDSEPEPDVAIVPGTPRDYLNAHPSTAVLVVEVADSSLRLDRRFKAGLYARARLPEYWIANLTDRILEVHREPEPMADGAYGWMYRSVAILHRGDSVTPLALFGRTIPVADLLP
jgi:Uma2 family endonuclease